MKHLWVLLLLAGCAAARPAAAPTRAPAVVRAEPRQKAPPPRPYGTVDIDATDEPLLAVLDAVAAAADRPIAAAVSSETRVTLSLHAAPWRDVLDYLVHAYHLVRRDTGKVIVLEEPPHNRLMAEGASPATWFLLLARQGNFSLVLPGDLPGDVSVTLYDVRYEDALRATAKTYGLEVEPVR